MSAEQGAKLSRDTSENEVFAWGKRQYHWQVDLSVDSFPELEKYLINVHQQLRKEISVDIRWASHSPGAVSAMGQVELALKGNCQRCLEPVEHTQMLDIAWLLVKPRQQNAQMQGLETIVVEDESTSQLNLLEEELLMEISPLFVHSNLCVEINNEVGETHRPFADIKAMFKTSMEK